MADPLATYHIRSRGWWTRTHDFSDAEGQPLGRLIVRRNGWGLVVSGEYQPEKGEVLRIRRDPGLLRGQFSLWTEGGEWLGSSLRWALVRRQIDLWTGGKPYRLVPLHGFRRGWRIVAAKTGSSATLDMRPGLLSWLTTRDRTEARKLRKIDFELIVFAHFLGMLTRNESFWPTSLDPEAVSSEAAAPARA
jgi:hypothetical protein